MSPSAVKVCPPRLSCAHPAVVTMTPAQARVIKDDFILKLLGLAENQTHWLRPMFSDLVIPHPNVNLGAIAPQTGPDPAPVRGRRPIPRRRRETRLSTRPRAS